MEGEGGLIEREGVLGPVSVSSLSFITSFSSQIPVVVSPVDGSWLSAVVAVPGGYWWAVGGHGGWACLTLVGCDAPWMLFTGASGGARSPLVGVGDGRSPLFVLPCCVLAFVAGRGWWWVLMLALSLIRVTWLCAPARRWWWVLAVTGCYPIQ